jgi:hypothetical protein
MNEKMQMGMLIKNTKLTKDPNPMPPTNRMIHSHHVSRNNAE